jgi:exodeoxyribonuclease VII large subunit
MEQKNLNFGSASPGPPRERKALTVSELTDRIQGVLETEFIDVLLEGEVSNLNLASSGHWYFSLKDDKAAIRAVVWKSAARFIRFRPRDGMKVLARGQVRVYAPRGEYQISVDLIEPLGKGSLQQAFEDLKERLSREGFFDEARKKRLPMLPKRIGVVTSPGGAVIRDILRVLSTRYRNLEVLIYPARVQGPEAAGEIVEGIRALSRLPGIDVLILARGGGSLEELWPFNEESVARAIAASPIPTISAVGHETDFTIADFVADVRAPTPSAAAEQVVKAKEDLEGRIRAAESRLRNALGLKLARTRARVHSLTLHRVFEAERGRLRTQAQTVDEAVRRSGAALERRVERGRNRFVTAASRLAAFPWAPKMRDRRATLERAERRGSDLVLRILENRRGLLQEKVGRLESLSPLGVLSRGYALVFGSRGNIVKGPEEVRSGETIRIRVQGGDFSARVEPKESN